MSQDQFTKVTTESWFSRLGNAFKGMLVGGLMFLVAFPLLFWNEGRAVKQQKSLEEGKGAVVSVECDKVDPAHDGKLVHVSGTATTDEVLRDPVFGVEANAIRLVRNVEMYQWKEEKSETTKKKLGGGTETVTTYNYVQQWSAGLNDSSSFEKPNGHENPNSFPYDSTKFVAKKVTLGAFVLPPSLVARMTGATPLKIDPDMSLPEELVGKAKIQGDGFYIGDDPASPSVGDVRVSFTLVKPAEVSVVAQQTGETFQPAPTKAGNSIELLTMGRHSAEEMFQEALSANRTMTWILRLVGFVIMGIGLSTVFAPLSVVADVVPLFGRIVGAGTTFVAFLVAGFFSLITIAIAWLYYRPLFGITLLVIAGAVGVFIVMKLRGPKTQPA